MRRLISWLGVLALLWTGWWYLATWGIGRGVELAVQDRRAAGWQADIGFLDQRGYPLSLRTEFHDLRLRDPVSGLALFLPELTLRAAAYWPGNLSVDLPAKPIVITTPQGQLDGVFEQARAEMRLHPGASLELRNTGLTSGRWTIGGPLGQVISARTLRLDLTQEATDPASYAFDLTSEGFEPGPALRTVLALPGDWPAAFDALTLQGSMQFDHPLDHSSLSGPTPQPRAITLRQGRVVWGPVQMTADADLSFDTSGTPEGTLDLRIAEWQQLLTLAEQAGVPSDVLQQTQIMLRAIANMDGDPATLAVMLSFREGAMFLGPIALGPAPRLRLP